MLVGNVGENMPLDEEMGCAVASNLKNKLPLPLTDMAKRSVTLMQLAVIYSTGAKICMVRASGQSALTALQLQEENNSINSINWSYSVCPSVTSLLDYNAQLIYTSHISALLRQHPFV